jgi:hypothetical protein
VSRDVLHLFPCSRGSERFLYKESVQRCAATYGDAYVVESIVTEYRRMCVAASLPSRLPAMCEHATPNSGSPPPSIRP